MADTKEPEARNVLNIYQKLAAITAEIGQVEKGGKNREQGYAFIEYAAVAGKLRTLFGKYGVVMVPRMAKTEAQQRVELISARGAKGLAVLIDFEFEVINADKPDDKFTVTWSGEAADYGDKATNKAATSAIKYYQMRQFNISEQGDDPDHESPDRGSVSGKSEPSRPTPPPKPYQQAQLAKAPAEPTPAAEEPITGLATRVQKATLAARLRGRGVKSDDMADTLKSTYHVADPEHMTVDDFNRVIAFLDAAKAADKEVEV
jgi:hypothetical protein